MGMKTGQGEESHPARKNPAMRTSNPKAKAHFEPEGRGLTRSMGSSPGGSLPLFECFVVKLHRRGPPVRIRKWGLSCV